MGKSRKAKQISAQPSKSKTELALELAKGIHPAISPYEAMAFIHALHQTWEEIYHAKNLKSASCINSANLLIPFFNSLIFATGQYIQNAAARLFIEEAVNKLLVRIYFHFHRFESVKFLKESDFKWWFTILFQLTELRHIDDRTNGILLFLRQLLALIVKPSLDEYNKVRKVQLHFLPGAAQDVNYVDGLNLQISYTAKLTSNLATFKTKTAALTQLFMPDELHDLAILEEGIKLEFTNGILTQALLILEIINTRCLDVSLDELRTFVVFCESLEALTSKSAFNTDDGKNALTNLIFSLKKILNRKQQESDEKDFPSPQKKSAQSTKTKPKETKFTAEVKPATEKIVATATADSPHTQTKTQIFITTVCLNKQLKPKEKLIQLNVFLNDHVTNLTPAERLTLHAYRAQFMLDSSSSVKNLTAQIEILTALNAEATGDDRPTDSEITALIAELRKYAPAPTVASATMPKAKPAEPPATPQPTGYAATDKQQRPVKPPLASKLRSHVSPTIEAPAVSPETMIDKTEPAAPAVETIVVEAAAQAEPAVVETPPVKVVEIPAAPKPFDPYNLSIPDDMCRVLRAVQQVGPHSYFNDNKIEIKQDRHEAYFVGGMVRDLEQEMDPASIKDVDIIVCGYKWSPVIDSQQRIKFFRDLAKQLACAQNDIEEILTQNQTLIRFRYNGIEYDVTFSKASRTTNAMWRDFKCNSLLADADGNVIEILSGAIHEARNKVLSPCDENEFFKDWVRVLRAPGFLARDNYTYVSAAFEAKINQALKTLEQCANKRAQLISLITFGGNEMSPAYGRFKSHLKKLLRLPATQFAKIAHLINPAALKDTLDGVFFAPGFRPLASPTTSSFSTAPDGLFGHRSTSPTSVASSSSSGSGPQSSPRSGV